MRCQVWFWFPHFLNKASQILRVGHTNNKGKKEESVVQNLRKWVQNPSKFLRLSTIEDWTLLSIGEKLWLLSLTIWVWIEVFLLLALHISNFLSVLSLFYLFIYLRRHENTHLAWSLRRLNAIVQEKCYLSLLINLYLNGHKVSFIKLLSLLRERW